jgi:hypothetical protein
MRAARIIAKSRASENIHEAEEDEPDKPPLEL